MPYNRPFDPLSFENQKEILQTVLFHSLVVKLLFGMRKLSKLMSDHVLRDKHWRIVLPVVH